MSNLDITTVYLEATLEYLPGEVWKDVPGFEGSYMASNLGRVKSLDRVVPHPRLKSQSVKGHVFRQSISKNKNLLTGEPMIDLRVTLTVENKSYYFNTRRLIYQTFINTQLDYSKDGMYVINVDGNGYDNRPENLKLVTKSDKQKRVFIRNRMENTLKTADRSNWKKNTSLCKEVAQYDLNGNLIKVFPSVSQAPNEMKLGTKAIIQVAKGLYKQWNGFVWMYISKEK